MESVTSQFNGIADCDVALGIGLEKLNTDDTDAHQNHADVDDIATITAAVTFDEIAHFGEEVLLRFSRTLEENLGC